jgi:hypothetical protein
MNPSIFKKVIIFSERNRIWPRNDLNPNLKHFIDALLKLNPKERLGAKGWDEVKQHPFFTAAGFDWTALSEQRMISPLLTVIAKQASYDFAEIISSIAKMASVMSVSPARRV